MTIHHHRHDRRVRRSAVTLCTILLSSPLLFGQAEKAKSPPAEEIPDAIQAPPLPGQEPIPGAENLDVFEQVLVGQPVAKAKLEAAIAKERKKGTSEQAIAEIRFVWAYQSNNDKEVAAVLPAINKLGDTFDSKNSPMALKKRDWAGIREYVRAIAAKEKGDMDSFKRHLLEAIWESPEQSTIFLRPLVDIRADADAKVLAEAIKKIKPDLDRALKTSDGKSHTLREMLKGKKALLIDFWSFHCAICQESMPGFAEKSAYMSKHGVASAAVNIEDGVDAVEKARKEFGVTDPWITDGKNGYLANTFLASETPHTVLLDPQGKVLFAGFPLDPALWDALKKVNPKIQPEKPEEFELEP